MAYLTGDDLLALAVGQTVDFTTPELGTVKLRSLTVLEFADLTRNINGDQTRIVVKTVSMGMVEPQMTFDQLMELRAGVLKLLDPVAQKIAEISAFENGDELENFLGGGS